MELWQLVYDYTVDLYKMSKFDREDTVVYNELKRVLVRMILSTMDYVENPDNYNLKVVESLFEKANMLVRLMMDANIVSKKRYSTLLHKMKPIFEELERVKQNK